MRRKGGTRGTKRLLERYKAGCRYRNALNFAHRFPSLDSLGVLLFGNMRERRRCRLWSCCTLSGSKNVLLIILIITIDY